jgi:two-component system cell cycle sensor histidine kinase/response regulator CckA
MLASPPPIATVLETLPDAVVVVDDADTIVLVNAQAEALLGRPRAELLGGNVEALMPDRVEVSESRLDRFSVLTLRRARRTRDVLLRQQAAIAALGQRALAGEATPTLMQEAAEQLAAVLGIDLVEVLELVPDDDELQVRGQVGPARTADDDGLASELTVPMVVGARELGAVTVRSPRPREFSQDDVHFVQAVANALASALDRRRAEEQRELGAARLRDVIDASPAVIYLKDLEGRVILANRGFETLFGVPTGAAVGRANPEFVAPMTAAEIAANDAAVVAAGTPLEFEERLQTENGVRVFISLKFPLRDAAGRIHGVGGLSTDVTERSRASDHRAALETRLARAERLESVGQLAGGIAHDFNNLLAVIANYAGFLATAVEPGSRAAADVEQILVACRAANELTRRLLLFSRRRSGNPETIDLTAVIAETEQLLRRTLGEQVELRTAVEPGVWSVEADRAQIEQVLMNLAINARDAMPEGGRLAIEAGNVVLAAGEIPDMEGEAVRLVVSDTGVGMAEEVLDRAFEPFFTTKPAGEASGLGLATVYGIVRGAGGQVELRSAPEGGTAVVVHLPASHGAAPAGEPRPPDRPGAGSGESVMLVEDKEAVRILTERILTDAGYRVRIAADGLEALALHADDDQVDVLVTDIVMPGLSGQELADGLRQQRPGLPVVFVSGYTEDYVVEEARREGATAFVEKPFSADQLLAAVRAVLEEGAQEA